MRQTILLVTLMAASITGSDVAAQVDQKHTFDVVSIKPHNPDDHSGGWANRDGRQTIMATTPLILITSAFGLQQYEVFGVPDWAVHESLDVLTLTDPAAKKDLAAMMQSMLEDRFGLKAHKETRDVEKYRLVFARPDRRLGAQLVQDDVDCKTPNRTAPCGMRVSGTQLQMTAVLFPQFVRFLESVVRRRIDDETDLGGRYDLTLEWARGPNDAEHPVIFTALQEQLGLKLETTHGPSTVLVVDHLDHPTPN